jgi:predicted TIM-barrel fold metal-dependent hydrolase
VLAAARVARRFPGLSLLVGHSGGADVRAIDQALSCAADLDNLYLDLTMSLTYDGLIERMLARVPVEKVLYGSDMAYMDPRTQIGRIVFSRIGDAAIERILGLNFLDLVQRAKKRSGGPR